MTGENRCGCKCECVCVCVSVREREKLCVCVCKRETERERENLCVCVCVIERQRERDRDRKKCVSRMTVCVDVFRWSCQSSKRWIEGPQASMHRHLHSYFGEILTYTYFCFLL